MTANLEQTNYLKLHNNGSVVVLVIKTHKCIQTTIKVSVICRQTEYDRNRSTTGYQTVPSNHRTNNRSQKWHIQQPKQKENLKNSINQQQYAQTHSIRNSQWHHKTPHLCGNITKRYDKTTKRFYRNTSHQSCTPQSLDADETVNSQANNPMTRHWFLNTY
jgi:hypothetical protein